MIFYTHTDSPVGKLTLTGNGEALTGLYFSTGNKALTKPDPAWRKNHRMFSDVIRQLNEYFGGLRTGFECALAPEGTDFQLQVLEQLQQIPFGQIRSYKDVALSLQRPGAFRAVGAANARNPIAIIIPCHRVVGANGSLTGFGGGLDAKSFLLGFEATQASLLKQAL